MLSKYPKPWLEEREWRESLRGRVNKLRPASKEDHQLGGGELFLRQADDQGSKNCPGMLLVQQIKNMF